MSYYQINYESFADKFAPFFLYQYDFDIRNGDLYDGNSDDQDIHFILATSKGQIRQDIKIGIGIYKKLNSNINKTEHKKLIREQLEYDGFKVSEIYILTYEDAIKLNIKDSELMRILKQNQFVIDINANR
jgi:hypothetical protein